MTTTRTCPGCGYKFRAEPGQDYCSAICAGNVSMGSLLLALQQTVRAQAQDAATRRPSMTDDNVITLPCHICAADPAARCDLAWYLRDHELREAARCPLRLGKVPIPAANAQVMRQAVEIARDSPVIAAALLEEDPPGDEPE